jgi:glycosyltransferase involved in cell wall biosynthesis
MDRLARANPNVKWIIVGEGPQREAIESEIRKLRLEANFQLLGLRSDVPRLLAAADVLALTSVSEGIPLTIIEAMAAGLPVVATSVGGVPEIVVDQQTGFLVPKGDDEKLAAAILSLAEDPELRGRMGAAGHARAAAMFSDKQMNSTYASLYDQMLSGQYVA